MKLVHLSDLHLGKRVNEFSMLEDQTYILTQILHIIDEEVPDAILIAGDIYDKSIPTAEAVELFDDFLYQLSQRRLQVFIISGNHDSPERLSFGSRLIDSTGIHISPVYNGNVTPVSLTDEFGIVDIWMLPFLKPAHIRKYFPDEPITSYSEAISVALSHLQFTTGHRNVLVTHQFVTGATRSESEDISVGGSDNVDVSVFDNFDYVALGHIHGPQNISSQRVRYCGTPLKYSFSEVSHHKSVTIAELGNTDLITVRTVPLTPLHDMVELKGTYSELTLKSFYENTDYPQDYVHITLTDEDDIPDAISKLRVIYPNLMKLDYDNARTRHNSVIQGDTAREQKSPFELFSDFYQLQNNQPLSEAQSQYLHNLIESIWEEEK